jgi:hypothetical protein
MCRQVEKEIGMLAGRFGRPISIRWIVTLLVCALSQLIAPTRAYAMFGWLDHLSGPGPFGGVEFEIRVLCVMRQPSPGAVLDAELDADLKTNKLLEQALMTAEQAKNTSGVARLQKILKAQSDLKGLSGHMGPYGFLVRSALAEAIKRDISQSTIDQGNQENLIRTWDIAARKAREATVPRFRELPGLGLDASCRDRRIGGDEVVEFTDQNGQTIQVRRTDRHPLFSLSASYRYDTTDAFLWYDSTRSPQYAGGEPIHLNILEQQLSWPLTGRLDLADGHVGIGLYRFSSPGLDKSLWGLMIEPVRFEVHFPARLANDICRGDDPDKHGLCRPFWKWTRIAGGRILASLGYRVGVVMFPSGFPANAFKGTSTQDTPAISGSETVFEKGVVINIGRLFGL